MSAMEEQKIKGFWDERGSDAELSEESVTLPDRNQRLLEIELVLERLPNRQRILDVGCGNGFSTHVFAKHASFVLGVDYSEAMVERARQDYGDRENIDFQVQDVLALEVPEDKFDIVVSQRCLINIPSWEDQQRAIANIAAVLQPGGYFFFQEGSRQGREALNQVREMLGLERMPEVPFNLDFDEEVLWPFIRQHYDVVEVRRFGYYDLISRVVHPLLVSPEQPKYAAKINEIAARLSAKLTGADELSRQFLATLRRLSD